MVKKSKRKICIITSSRADYGILKPLLLKIRKSSFLDLYLVVTGSHLSRYYGSTYKEILNDGLKIDSKIHIGNIFNSSEQINSAISNSIKKIFNKLKIIKPDIVCLCGDRYEIFGAAVSATILNIPIAHIHGGESTFGAFDESFRHSITKMSHLHFTSTKEYKSRVIQLGENSKNVFNVGSLAVDSLKKDKLLNKNFIERNLKFKFMKKNILVTYHPVTLEDDNGEEKFINLLKVLSSLKGTQIIFTMSNADTGSRQFNDLINEFINNNSENSISFKSLGSLMYLSCAKHVDVIIGNSSSAIIEIPSLCKPTINIGKRQDGRVKARNNNDCNGSIKSILNSINKAYSKKFLNSFKNLKNPYLKRNTSINIIKTLVKVSLNNILFKKFNDLKKNE